MHVWLDLSLFRLDLSNLPFQNSPTTRRNLSCNEGIESEHGTFQYSTSQDRAIVQRLPPIAALSCTCTTWTVPELRGLIHSSEHPATISSPGFEVFFEEVDALGESPSPERLVGLAGKYGLEFPPS